MSHLVLFVLGPPGVGKTTLIRTLVPALKPDSGLTRTEIASPKWTFAGHVAVAGHWRGNTFDGGDTVPYTGARAALEYWRDNFLPNLRKIDGLTIFDGDRFSTQPSLDFINSLGERVLGVYLDAGPEILDARRAARGSNQNAVWMRGRVTKAKNFAAKIPSITVAADSHPDVVARVVSDEIQRAQREKAA